MLSRRSFLQSATAVAGLSSFNTPFDRAFSADSNHAALPIATPKPGEDVFAFVNRTTGGFDSTLYFQILGAANEFKEGDESIGVAAVDTVSRNNARRMLGQTTIGAINSHPLIDDELSAFNRGWIKSKQLKESTTWTLEKLKTFLLESDETAIRPIMEELSSEVIGCVVKLMNNSELIAVGQKVFNPLPGSSIGAKGYLGARVQPNSPTDNVDDIRWQVFDAWSYGVGDVLLGTNPVSSDPKSVAAVERTLKDLLSTFGIEDLMPHCVLSHIDVQAEFTNGHAHGFDMVLHESRKYGMARALTQDVANAQQQSGRTPAPWVHLNDVAGFIGPEVFRTKEQLVRCCLEDIVMGKLHGLCLGLDVCSTLHMDVSLDDLDWCLDQIMPANPAYLMALPTKIDPMLGYLTTGYQDHVRLRKKFGYKVNDAMWKFFQTLGVVDRAGNPGKNFGQPLNVFVEYQRRKGDTRTEAEIHIEGRRQLAEVRGRGVFIADGHGASPSDLRPQLKSDINQIYNDAKESIWAELSDEFVDSVPNHVLAVTQSTNRQNYILHPESGEQLSPQSSREIGQLRQKHAGHFDVQIVISDGLNAYSIMDDGHLEPFLSHLRTSLQQVSMRVAPENIVVTSGRVRAGYRIGESLFGDLPGSRAILHVIGERPGTGHHTFSTYITAPQGNVWSTPGAVDHNITKVVSGIALTALKPDAGAKEVARILMSMAAST